MKRNWPQLLEENADEPHAATPSPRRFTKRGHTSPITTTSALACGIQQALGSAQHGRRKTLRLKPASAAFSKPCASRSTTSSARSKCFCATCPMCLKPGGRVAILTFHSGEDRRVKKAFQAGERGGIYASIAREVIRPSPKKSAPTRAPQAPSSAGQCGREE